MIYDAHNQASYKLYNRIISLPSLLLEWSVQLTQTMTPPPPHLIRQLHKAALFSEITNYKLIRINTHNRNALVYTNAIQPRERWVAWAGFIMLDLDPMRKTFLHLMTMIYECDQGPRARLAILCILYFKTFSVLLYLYDCPFQFISRSRP